MSNLLEQVKPILIMTVNRWLNLTETLSVELLTRKPAPGEWSAFECLTHLHDTEAMVFPVRVRSFLEGKDTLASFDPDTQEPKNTNWTPRQFAEDFARLRNISLAELERVTAADFASSSRHTELGIVTLSEMLHEWAAHDLMHTVQAERALMQPFIQLSGPWRGYFSDHDVEKK